MTKSYDFPYPIYDLAKNLIPHVLPLRLSPLPIYERHFADGLIDNDEKVASS